MTDRRYLPDDGSLLEQLDILQEECAEVIVAASKLKRFGPQAIDPHTGRRYDNVVDLRNEIDDVRQAWLRVERLLP